MLLRFLTTQNVFVLKLVVLLSCCCGIKDLKSTTAGRMQWHAAFIKCHEIQSVDLRIVLIGCIPLCINNKLN
jgi:hypothetical protein